MFRKKIEYFWSEFAKRSKNNEILKKMTRHCTFVRSSHYKWDNIALYFSIQSLLTFLLVRLFAQDVVFCEHALRRINICDRAKWLILMLLAMLRGMIHFPYGIMSSANKNHHIILFFNVSKRNTNNLSFMG